MPRIPTVTIEAKTEKGHRIINESDFDPKKHKKFTPKAKAPKAKAT